MRNKGKKKQNGRNSEKMHGKSSVTKGASPIVIQSCECFLRAYQNFFGVLSVSNRPNYPNFKSLVIEELDKNSPDDGVIAVILDQIKNSSEKLIRKNGCFYQTNYALCTSKFFEKLQNKCCEQHMNAVRVDCIEDGTMQSFYTLNQRLREKLQKGALFDKKNDYRLSGDCCIDDIKDWFDKNTAMGKLKETNPNGKCVVFVDHLDNFFISMFEKSVNKNKEKEGFSLYDISQLRRIWVYALCQLNIEGSIQCIASVLAPIDNELKTFTLGFEVNDPHGAENTKRIMGRYFVTRIVSWWREKHCYIALHGLFDKIHSMASDSLCNHRDKPNCLFRAGNTKKAGANENAQDVLKDWACTIVTTLRRNSDPQKMQVRDPDGAHAHSLCTLVEYNPWLLCLSFYHATRVGTSSSEFDCSQLDENLKSHYRAERQKRNQRPLIKDYLRLLPLCVASVIFYDRKKLKEEEEDITVRINTSQHAREVAKAIEKSWGKIRNQFYKNVIKLIQFYSKFYKKQYSPNSDPTKNWEKEVVIPKERSVERRLIKHLPRVFKNKKYVTGLTDAIVWGDVFGRTPSHFDNKYGVDIYKNYYARSFMHYLYSDAKTLQAVQESRPLTSDDLIKK